MRLFQTQGFTEVPGYGLAFAVFVTGQPDCCALGGRFEVPNDFFLFSWNVVCGRKTVGNIYVESLFW